jgi:FixJ family two-component response regulator
MTTIVETIDSLTRREKQCAMLMYQGLLNKQIAQRLGICGKTVEVHRSEVMRKTESGHVADLVRLLYAIMESPLLPLAAIERCAIKFLNDSASCERG